MSDPLWVSVGSVVRGTLFSKRLEPLVMLGRGYTNPQIISLIYFFYSHVILSYLMHSFDSLAWLQKVSHILG
jgi:hypothetical protein